MKTVVLALLLLGVPQAFAFPVRPATQIACSEIMLTEGISLRVEADLRRGQQKLTLSMYHQVEPVDGPETVSEYRVTSVGRSVPRVFAEGVRETLSPSGFRDVSTIRIDVDSSRRLSPHTYQGVVSITSRRIPVDSSDPTTPRASQTRNTYNMPCWVVSN